MPRLQLLFFLTLTWVGSVLPTRGATYSESAGVRQLRAKAQEQGHTAPEQARATLGQALALARRTHDGPGERGVLNDLADICGHLDELAAAQRYLNLSRHLAAQAQDTLELGRAYLFSSMVAEGDWDAHVRFAELARQQFALSPRYTSWLLRAQSELAQGYLTLNRLAPAKQMFRQALRLARQSGEAGPEFRLLINWAPALQRIEPDSARLLLNRARYLADEQLRTPYPRAFVRNAQARLARDQSRWAELVGLSKEAIQLGRQSHTQAVEAQALVYLADGLRYTGQAPAAYDTLRQAYRMHDSLEAEHKQGELARLRVRFDVERQQTRIQALEQERRVAELRAERQRTRVYGLLGGVVGFGLLSALLVRSRRRLQSSEADLRAANQTKDQLMRIIGHDLRAPLTSLQQLTPLLREVLEQPERAMAYQLIDTLDAGAQHAGSLVDNLFQWTRAQGGQLVNYPERIQAEAVIDSIATLYAPAAQLKQLTLVRRVQPPDLLVWADIGLLTTVLRNLMGNALKFTPTGGTVRLEASAAPDGTVAFAVTDSGQGISPARITQLLTTDRVDSTPGTNGEPGTGLGLPLCARFVRLMGGELHLEAAPGGGTRGWFRLPAGSPTS